MLEAIRSTRSEMVTIRLTTHEKAMLLKEAETKGMKLAEYIRTALNEYVK